MPSNKNVVSPRAPARVPAPAAVSGAAATPAARYVSGGPSFAAVLASPPRPTARPPTQPAPAPKQAPLTQFGVTGANRAPTTAPTRAPRGKKPKVFASANDRPIGQFFKPARQGNDPHLAAAAAAKPSLVPSSPLRPAPSLVPAAAAAAAAAKPSLVPSPPLRPAPSLVPAAAAADSSPLFFLPPPPSPSYPVPASSSKRARPDEDDDEDDDEEDVEDKAPQTVDVIEEG